MAVGSAALAGREARQLIERLVEGQEVHVVPDRKAQGFLDGQRRRATPMARRLLAPGVVHQAEEDERHLPKTHDQIRERAARPH